MTTSTFTPSARLPAAQPNRRRVGLKYATASAIALVAAVVFAAPAYAHDSVVASTPAEGETLTALPDEFSITTNEGLLDLSGTGSGFALQVIDSDGRYYGDGCLTIVDATMATPAALGAAGDYTMVWQAVSADGHTVSDEFTFEWAPPSEFEPATGSATAPACGGESAAAPASDSSESSLGDVLWIGGAILAIAIAAIVTFLIVGGKRSGRGAED